MALNKHNAETARSYDPADYPLSDETTNADDHRIFSARLGDLLAGGDFNGVAFDGLEVYAHWSDTAHGVVVSVHARRKLTSAEMGHLASLCHNANPGRPAVEVYAEWAATLDTPLEYSGNTVLIPESIYVDLMPMGRFS